MAVIACGSGLFSDGYVNGVIGSVNTMLRQIYGTVYRNSRVQSNVSAIAFAGAVVGNLAFGYTSDHWSPEELAVGFHRDHHYTFGFGLRVLWSGRLYAGIFRCSDSVSFLPRCGYRWGAPSWFRCLWRVDR
jgi:hypothetical protein